VMPSNQLCISLTSLSFTFRASVSPLREWEHCSLLPQGAGGTSFSASAPSHFMSFLVKEEMFYDKGGEAPAQAAQSSFGCPLPGRVQGRVGRGLEHPEKCPCSWHGGWTKRSLKVPSKPNHSVSPCAVPTRNTTGSPTGHKQHVPRS